MWNLHQLSFLFFKKYSWYDVFFPIDLVFGSREACDAINGVELEDLGDNVLPDPNLLIISLPTKVTHQRSFYSMNIMCDRQRMVNFSLRERRKIWRFCFFYRENVHMLLPQVKILTQGHGLGPQVVDLKPTTIFLLNYFQSFFPSCELWFDLFHN